MLQQLFSRKVRGHGPSSFSSPVASSYQFKAALSAPLCDERFQQRSSCPGESGRVNIAALARASIEMCF